MKKFENFKAALVNLNDIFSYKEPYGNCLMYSEAV